MAKVRLTYTPLGQVEAPDATAETLADLLSLSTDDDCLVIGVIVQADPSNTDEVYLGGVDAAGAADAAQNKCTKLTADRGISFEADDSAGDEDLCVCDLRQISLRAPVAGQNVNISVVKITQVQYTR